MFDGFFKKKLRLGACSVLNKENCMLREAPGRASL